MWTSLPEVPTTSSSLKSPPGLGADGSDTDTSAVTSCWTPRWSSWRATLPALIFWTSAALPMRTLQAFSWANLCARVTACDIAPTAIEIARCNALRLGLDVTFHVADAQTLDPIPDESHDMVFATYLGWFEDIDLAVRTWARVLRPDGRLLIDIDHPVTNNLERSDSGLTVEWPYFDRSPDPHEFTGTPVADQHGGWNRSLTIIWFHHTLADVFNAVAKAGLRIERVAERPFGESVAGGAPLDLPDGISLIARKPSLPR